METGCRGGFQRPAEGIFGADFGEIGGKEPGKDTDWWGKGGKEKRKGGRLFRIILFFWILFLKIRMGRLWGKWKKSLWPKGFWVSGEETKKCDLAQVVPTRIRISISIRISIRIRIRLRHRLLGCGDLGLGA